MQLITFLITSLFDDPYDVVFIKHDARAKDPGFDYRQYDKLTNVSML